MSKGGRGGQITSMRARENDGALVTLTPVVRSKDGNTVVMQLDLSTAPVPDRKYVANVASLIANDDEIFALFGQKKRGAEDNLRSLLEVHISADALHNMSPACSTMVGEIEKMLLAKNQNALPLTTINDEPAQTVAFTVNIAAIGYAGDEACLDFYFTSSFSIDRLRKEKNYSQLAVEPIVRVNLSSRLLVSFLKKLVEIDVSKQGGRS